MGRDDSGTKRAHGTKEHGAGLRSRGPRLRAAQPRARPAGAPGHTAQFPLLPSHRARVTCVTVRVGGRPHLCGPSGHPQPRRCAGGSTEVSASRPRAVGDTSLSWGRQAWSCRRLMNTGGGPLQHLVLLSPPSGPATSPGKASPSGRLTTWDRAAADGRGTDGRQEPGVNAVLADTDPRRGPATARAAGTSSHCVRQGSPRPGRPGASGRRLQSRAPRPEPRSRPLKCLHGSRGPGRMRAVTAFGGRGAVWGLPSGSHGSGSRRRAGSRRVPRRGARPLTARCHHGWA